MGRNIGEKLSSKYSQKFLDHAKQYAIDALKTASKRGVQKSAEATDDLIGNKIDDKILEGSKTSPQNSSETNEEEMPREKYIPPELRQKIIDDLRLKED